MKRILIVDRAAERIERLREIFAAAGHQVDVAEPGEGEGAASAEGCHLILAVPEGLDAFTEGEVPVICLVDNVLHGARCLGGAVRDYIVAPIGAPIDVRAIRAALDWALSEHLEEPTPAASEADLLRRELATQARWSQVLLDVSTESLFMLDLEGIVLACNETTARRLGATREELEGRNIYDFHDPESRSSRMAWHEWIREHKKPMRFRDERAGLVFDVSVEPVFDESGELIAAALHARDVTQEVVSRESAARERLELERFRQNMEAMLAAIDETIVSVDANLRILAANAEERPLCAATRGRLRVGGSYADLACGPDAPCLGVLRRALDSGAPVRVERAICTNGGSERLVDLQASPLEPDDGGARGAVLVARQAAELSSASALRESEGPDESGLEGLLGESQAIRAIFGKIEQLAEYDSLVLITGESGTGKELAAEAIHRGSRRAAGPLVKVNCAALSETLLESELFGHVRGSFTGAVRDKVGRFQAAEGGSLFLDEIGDMSPQIQLKLLRFLEQYEYERVGESTTRQADVRIIAATNADLQAKVRDGLFREDLFYRIKVVGLHMPPLRERVGDVPLLAAHFLRRYAPPGQGEPRISKEVMEFLVRHQWPGNVRELRHAMEHASVMSRGEAVELRHLPDELREVTPPRQHGGGSGVGPEDIFEALRASDFNKARAAKLLGISRVTLYRKLERHADLRRRIEALSRKR